MTIKLAMIADHPEPGAPIDGGVQAVTSYLVDALSKFHNIELTILSFRLGIRQTEFFEHENYDQYLIPFSGIGALTLFRRDQANLDDCLTNIEPDIVHSQGAGHHGILATRSQYPSVTTIHGIHTQEAQHLRGIRRRMRTRLQGWMTQHFCIKHASHTILISPYVAEFFGKELAGKRYLIPNPVNPLFFNIPRAEESKRILFLGRLYALKGVKDLLVAASKVASRTELKIILAGSLSDSRYVAELKDLVVRLNISESVEFTGILSMDRVLYELAKCTCLVLPSYQETAPMVIQEAMAGGVPIIATNICGIPYQIQHGTTGLLFPPGDVHSLTEHLTLLLSNDSLRRQYGQAAKEFAIREYHASIVAEKTVETYQRILGHI